MYTFVNTISALIREFLLPNPFENIMGNKMWADIFNIFVGGAILHMLAFFMTGCWYTRGVNKPVGGSFGYLISYCFITFLFVILSNFIKDLEICLIVFLGIYIAVCVLLKVFLRTKTVTF